jgi:hypothetical protein
LEGPPTSQTSFSPRRPWSLYVIITWAIILAFNTGVILWDLTGPLAQFGSPDTLFGWLSLALAFAAPFGFGASVYGLWELRPWGRYLFLTMSTLFFGFNLIGVWLPGGVPPNLQDPTQIRNARLLASVRYGLALVIPLIYFNLNRIRALFQESASQQVSKSASQQISKSANQQDNEPIDPSD